MNTDEMTSEQYLVYMAKQAEKGTGYNKYGNKWVKVDGINFQSQAEADRYNQLKYLKKLGMIKGFIRQHLFKFIINGILITTWRCDFIVYHHDGSKVVEDVKGAIKREYLIVKQLMKACYGITIVEPNLKEPATKVSRKKKLSFRRK